jgi:septum formation protein
MSTPLILASSSKIRAQLLHQAGVPFEVNPARVDEETIKEALLAEDAPSRDIADALAEAKARKVAGSQPDRLVLGCDQILAFGKEILSKPNSAEEAIEHLQMLRGQRHQLLSAAVIYEGGKPVWRHVGVVRLSMRESSDVWLKDYVARNWDSIQHSVGGYKLEEEGVRLFTRIDGDHFTVLGMPLLELLSYLTLRGTLES